MRKKLEAIIAKHTHLAEQMADPEIYGDQDKLTPIAIEHSAMEGIVNVGKVYISVLDQIADDKEILDGDDDDLIKILNCGPKGTTPKDLLQKIIIKYTKRR